MAFGAPEIFPLLSRYNLSKIDNHSINVFFKKLGYNSELEDLDRNLCKLVNQMEGCNMKKATRKILESLNADSRYCGMHSTNIYIIKN